MPKSKWIKSGPHKNTRGGGPAKTARGKDDYIGINQTFARLNRMGISGLGQEQVAKICRARGDRRPRGMQ